MKQLLTLTMLLAGMSSLSSQEMEIKGEVVKRYEVLSPSGNVNVVAIDMRTEKGEVVTAHLGPSWFLNTDFKQGEKITLTGKYTYRNVFMVKEMVKNNVRFRLRDETYNPLWIRTRIRARRCFYNPQTEVSVKGKVEEVYLVSPSLLMEANVKLQNGEILRVRLAPSWYLQNRIKPGDELEIRGSEIRFDGEKMIMAREMRNLKTKEEITLRDMQGFPLWSGRKGPGPSQMKPGRRMGGGKGRW